MEQNSVRRETLGTVLRGDGETLESYVSRMRSKLEYLVGVCQVHFPWFTHRNIAGCWICDALVELSAVLDELKRAAEVFREKSQDASGAAKAMEPGNRAALDSYDLADEEDNVEEDNESI